MVQKDICTPVFTEALFTVAKTCPVFLSGKFHGQRSLVGYSARGHKESDTTEQLTLSLSLHPHTVSGNVSWCSHCVKQYGGSLEN